MKINNTSDKNLKVPLTDEQKYILNYEALAPEKDVYSLYMCARMDGMDIERLADAVNRALKWYQVFSTIYYKEGEETYQKFIPDEQPMAVVEQITEEEFENLKDSLLQPFQLYEEYLYRCRLFQTEKYSYIFLQIHHSLFDGTSFTVFFYTISDFFAGRQPIADTYDRFLKKTLAYQLTKEEYGADEAYFNAICQKQNYEKKPKASENTGIDPYALILKRMTYDIPASVQQKIEDTCLRENIGKNIFYMAVALIALAKYNQCEHVMCSWNFNGRIGRDNKAAAGAVYKTLPVFYSFSKEWRIEELYAHIKNEMFTGMRKYQYDFMKKDKKPLVDDCMCTLYQKNLYDISLAEKLFPGDTKFSFVNLKNAHEGAYASFDLEIIEDHFNETFLRINYNAGIYLEEDIRSFMQLMVDVAEELMKD